MKTQGFFGVSGLLVVLLSASWAVTESHAQLTNFQRVYSFGSLELSGSYPLRIIESSDGRLYGIGLTETYDFDGILFRIDKDGTGYQVLHRFKQTEPSGHSPWGGFVEGSDGAFYGVTRKGGAYDRGAVFKINKDGTGLMVVHLFGGVTDSGLREPVGLIEGSDGS